MAGQLSMLFSGMWTLERDSILPAFRWNLMPRSSQCHIPENNILKCFFKGEGKGVQGK